MSKKRNAKLRDETLSEKLQSEGDLLTHLLRTYFTVYKMIANNKRNQYFSLPKSSLGSHTADSLSFCWRTPLVSEFNFSANRTKFVNRKYINNIATISYKNVAWFLSFKQEQNATVK